MPATSRHVMGPISRARRFKIGLLGGQCVNDGARDPDRELAAVVLVIDIVLHRCREVIDDVLDSRGQGKQVCRCFPSTKVQRVEVAMSDVVSTIGKLTQCCSVLGRWVTAAGESKHNPYVVASSGESVGEPVGLG